MANPAKPLGLNRRGNSRRIERAVTSRFVHAAGARASETERSRFQELLHAVVPRDPNVTAWKEFDVHRPSGHDSSGRGGAANSGIAAGAVPAAATTVVVMPPRTLK